ncbi:hypothetical protein [Actinomadura sp. 21ATH]|uniref:hypothetical protein n=1 Tax=Actinomadura sp. 21ATH TaxID=1735444 RepID=UPI0035C107B0
MSTSYTRERSRPDGREDAPAGRSETGGRPRSARVRTALVWAALGWIIGIERLDDNSFLTHLRTGRWILEHGVPHADIYSYTVPGTTWIAQSWLVEVVYAAIAELAGPTGIRVLGGCFGAACAYLACRLADRAGGGRTVALLLPALFVSSLYWVERPLFVGILALLALLWIVEVPDSAAGRWPLATIPSLMFLWANSHGTFALGFGYLALHLLGRWADGAVPWRDRELRLLQASGLALLACLINPYGARLVLFPLDLLARGDALRHVSEWKSPNFHTMTGIAFAVWIAVFVVVIALARTRPSRRDVLVSVPFLLLGLWAMRNAAIAPLVALPVLARLLPGARPAVPRPRADMVIVVVVLVFMALLTRAGLSDPPFDLRHYPVAAMRAVEQQGLLGRRLFTQHAWSAYVIHAYWPRQRVFMDDRFDMYPVAFTENYMKVRDGDARWRPTFERYGVDVVVWRTGAALTEIVSREPGWRVVHRDAMATVLARR